MRAFRGGEASPAETSPSPVCIRDWINQLTLCCSGKRLHQLNSRILFWNLNTNPDPHRDAFFTQTCRSWVWVRGREKHDVHRAGWDSASTALALLYVVFTDSICAYEVGHKLFCCNHSLVTWCTDSSIHQQPVPFYFFFFKSFFFQAIKKKKILKKKST